MAPARSPCGAGERGSAGPASCTATSPPADVEALVAARRVGARCVWQMHTGFEGYSLRQRLKDLVKVARDRASRRPGDRRVRLGRLDRPPARLLARCASRRSRMPSCSSRFDRLPERAAARARFRLDPAAQVALVLAWWPEVKGADLVISAPRAACRRRQRPSSGYSSARSVSSSSSRAASRRSAVASHDEVHRRSRLAVRRRGRVRQRLAPRGLLLRGG